MAALTRILYVEDDLDIAEIGTITLGELGGFEVCHCPSGMAAVDAFTDIEPQLLLLDVMMPGMDGIETLQRIRKLPGGENVPVVFMTAKAQMHEQKAYCSLGAEGVIVKPFDPMTLCDEVTGFWERVNEHVDSV